METNKVLLAGRKVYFTISIDYQANKVKLDRYQVSTPVFTISDHKQLRSYSTLFLSSKAYNSWLSGVNISASSHDRISIYEFWKELIDYKPEWLP
jgi:hypothetical protein